MSTSLDNYPNAYDLQASEPIKEILEKYFTDIIWTYEFQEANLSNKKTMLLDIALEIDRALNPQKGKTEQYLCQSYVNDDGKIVDCSCGKCTLTPITNN